VNSKSTFIWGILFGSFGLAYFVYGKKQKKVLSLLCGVGLRVFPYFITNMIAFVLIGVVLVVAPWVIQY
jgi:hypothetical protein